MIQQPTSVLVIDSTGRGHAICDLFVRTNPQVTVYYGPGCDVIEHDRIRSVGSISLTDPATAIRFLQQQPVEFVFVSNIDALSIGYADVLRAAGYPTVGPGQAAAELESSKARGKQFCLDHGIPVADFEVFSDADKARDHVSRLDQCVVKTDGLTPDGDGSVVCESPMTAIQAVDRFAATAGAELRLVVEQRLIGQEISVLALLDRNGALMFPLALDYKRSLDGDLGTNCDGMGSISPHPLDDARLRDQLYRQLLVPLLAGLREEQLDFTGFVYLGAMLTAAGPAVFEINTRFGDSEAEAVLPGVQSDFLELCRAVLDGRLSEHRLRCDDLARCSIALVQGGLEPDQQGNPTGWPFGEYSTGHPVDGLNEVDGDQARLFYANLRRDPAGRPVTAGGRVLHVVGFDASADQARRNAYHQSERVVFPGKRVRSDIGGR